MSNFFFCFLVSLAPDYETFIVSDPIEQSLTEFTISWWYKPSNPAVDWNSLGLYADDSIASVFNWFSYSQVQFEFGLDRAYDPSPFVDRVSSTSDGWVHIAGSWRASDGAVRMYINGTQVAQQNFTPVRFVLPSSKIWNDFLTSGFLCRKQGVKIPSGVRLYVGRPQAPGWSDRFYGLVDEFAFFNASLTPAQVASLRESVPTTDVIPSSSMLLYWGFEDIDGASNTILSQYGSLRLRFCRRQIAGTLTWDDM
jgi:hypothetical protein